MIQWKISEPNHYEPNSLALPTGDIADAKTSNDQENKDHTENNPIISLNVFLFLFFNSDLFSRVTAI